MLITLFIVAALDGQYICLQMVDMLCANHKWGGELGEGSNGQLNESATKGVECFLPIVALTGASAVVGYLCPRYPMSWRVRGQPWIKHVDAECPVTVLHWPLCGNGWRLFSTCHLIVHFTGHNSWLALFLGPLCFTLLLSKSCRNKEKKLLSKMRNPVAVLCQTCPCFV